MRALREHGQRAKYGTSSRATRPGSTRFRRSSCCASCRSSTTGTRSAARRRAYYGEALAGVGDLGLPPVAPGSEPVWHLFVVRTRRPDALAEFLRERGIGTGRHYPEPLHLSAGVSPLGYGAATSRSPSRSRRVLSLPIFPGISEEQLEHVVDAVGDYFGGG